MSNVDGLSSFILLVVKLAKHIQHGMNPEQPSPGTFPSPGADVSYGSSADEFHSFCSSPNRSRVVEDVTLQQLASAKETFTDLELAYKNFKHEMELVKEEHRREVSRYSSVVL